MPIKKDSLTVAIVRLFTTSHLSLLFLLISLLAGAAALVLTPREEDPQIIVPVMDVFVQYPGATSEEVEKRVTTPLEVLLKQIKGVEYVYSASRPGESLVTVRYEVGESIEDSLIKTRDKLQANLAALVDALVKAKPATSKGVYLRKVAVSSTMGVGVRVDTQSISA